MLLLHRVEEGHVRVPLFVCLGPGLGRIIPGSAALRKMENPQGSPLRAERARDDAVLGGPEADT